MAAENDTESARRASISTEQTPLLGDRSPEAEDGQSESSGANTTPETTKPLKNWTWYAWRILWALVAAIIIAVFVKGWIDADNTDVRYANLLFGVGFVIEVNMCGV